VFGGLDFVVNCAGRIDRFDAVAEMVRKFTRLSGETFGCTDADFFFVV
jgi:hypothetical protein